MWDGEVAGMAEGLGYGEEGKKRSSVSRTRKQPWLQSKEQARRERLGPVMVALVIFFSFSVFARSRGCAVTVLYAVTSA